MGKWKFNRVFSFEFKPFMTQDRGHPLRTPRRQRHRGRRHQRQPEGLPPRDSPTRHQPLPGHRRRAAARAGQARVPERAGAVRGRLAQQRLLCHISADCPARRAEREKYPGFADRQRRRACRRPLRRNPARRHAARRRHVRFRGRGAHRKFLNFPCGISSASAYLPVGAYFNGHESHQKSLLW